MVNQCLVIKWTIGYSTGKKKLSPLSPKDKEFRIIWVYFANLRTEH